MGQGEGQLGIETPIFRHRMTLSSMGPAPERAFGSTLLWIRRSPNGLTEAVLVPKLPWLVLPEQTWWGFAPSVVLDQLPAPLLCDS